jgi:flagellar motor switch protein FliN
MDETDVTQDQSQQEVAAEGQAESPVEPTPTPHHRPAPEPEAVPDSSDRIQVSGAEFQALESTPDDLDKGRKLDLLMDLSLPVSIELGRTSLLIRDILDLKRGQVVEFEKLASEPVDVLVNGKKMAEGEVVVIEKHFGIRITHLVEASERIKGLGK